MLPDKGSCGAVAPKLQFPANLARARGGTSGRGADAHGGPSEGPGGLPATQLSVSGKTAGSRWAAVQCCGRSVTRVAVPVPRLHTASSRKTRRTRHWRGFTATRRRRSRSGWSCGSKARAGGRNQGRGRAGAHCLSSSSRDPSVKRTLCRGCSSLLIPGLTCTQRQRRECCLGHRGGQQPLPPGGGGFR